MLNIDSARLWQSLLAMSQIGATGRGGVCRLALSAEDVAARRLFSTWCRQAGLSLESDAVGNLFARRRGRCAELAPVMMGSHLDSQPEGGNFDGVYGVLAALEVIRALNDHDVETRRPLEIACWTNEEGARFAPAMLGSSVFAGELPLEQALRAADSQGVTLAAALQASGCQGPRATPGPMPDAYFEAHIEQGPVLESRRLPIGVVSGGQGILWLEAELEGAGAHAGTTPRAYRRDALQAAAAILTQWENDAPSRYPQALWTCGQLTISKPSRNTVPGKVQFSLDLRHPDAAGLQLMANDICERIRSVAQARGIAARIETLWHAPPTPFDAGCQRLLAEAAARLGYPHQDIVSGAGHDAIVLARHCPSAMVFIPCLDGISHNEAESIEPEHAAMGANVLLHAVLARANAQDNAS
ncbi:Zn-dependent hydrolase [Chromobacterium sp. S0633]|uniref:Zn-dependent hydrolase n=1 Tax=Chromobacterium sp. S0633 TaxID=2957805 RepID=UPI00209F9977|nr:Zn-dependent hydrolase [Chromobacterium sp. S0633]MCP1291389.1 Zn-dependent hydrolase [Chromobacterium sp. S0633]